MNTLAPQTMIGCVAALMLNAKAVNAKTPKRQDAKQGNKAVLPQRSTKKNKKDFSLSFLCLFVANPIGLAWRLGALAPWRYLPWDSDKGAA